MRLPKSLILFIGTVTASYDVLYQNYAVKNCQDVAILVVAYNRPECLKECLRSMMSNEDIQKYAVIFALDGGFGATQTNNLELIKKSGIQNPIILLRERNYGCPKNHIDSKRFAFDWCGFKKVIVLEDDVVVSPYYFSFLLNFHTWATNNYGNVGIVQGWSYCYLSPMQKRQQLFMVTENPLTWSFLTYCLDRSVWDCIKEELYHYEKFIDQIPLTDAYTKERSRPANWEKASIIKTWMGTILQRKIISQKPCVETKLSLEKLLSSPNAVSQDYMMGFALLINGLVKLHTIVNRVVHIGYQGITTGPENFSQYTTIILNSFEEDKRNLNFTLV